MTSDKKAVILEFSPLVFDLLQALSHDQNITISEAASRALMTESLLLRERIEGGHIVILKGELVQRMIFKNDPEF